MLFKHTLITLILVMFATFAHAGKDQDGIIHHGELMLKDVRITALIPGAKVSAGYLEIANNGGESDRLIRVNFDSAGKAEIHTMEIDDGVMKMRPLKDGLEIAPGNQVSLAPGGYHLMFMKLDDFPKAGETVPLTLIFEKAGSVTLNAMVKAIKAGHDHSKHDQ
jgi:copper(I)-binding protein